VPITTTRSRAEAARRRERRILAGLLAIVALLVIGGGGLLWLASAPVEEQAPIGGPFQLTASDGRNVTDRDFRGKYLLIYFGYTICPDVCPTTLQSVAQALDTLGGKADRLQPVLVTVDPARDTPAVLAQYVAAFSPRLLGLSGTPQQIAQIEQEYHIYAAPRRTGPKPDDYTVDHSSALYLMGPDGSFVAKLPADAPPAELAAALAKRLS
jgi:cytochrome oxidase Cu insertion factor (SCO1/SenC/PrrC family)